MRSVHALILCCVLSTALSAATTGTSGAAAAADTPHPFSARDMVAMERLDDPQSSPDGKWVVFTRRAWDADERFGVPGKLPRVLYATARRSHSPRSSRSLTVYKVLKVSL